MIRRVIQIDEEKCNGCGICVTACHEGAIGMVDGKARLMRDDYCDGLGDCLPNCPTGAISFIEREAAAYDEAAVKANMERKETHKADQLHSAVHRCPGQAIPQNLTGVVYRKRYLGRRCSPSFSSGRVRLNLFLLMHHILKM